MIRWGIGEYLEYIRGCDAEIRDYVSDMSEATPLLGLLDNPQDDMNTLNVIENEAMRQHLSNALMDASAIKINIDGLMNNLKPKLLGFYKMGEVEFNKRLVDAVHETLAHYRADSEDRSWKVE